MVEPIKELRKICRKPNIYEEELYTKLVTRKISIYFTKLFLMLGMSGNQVTILYIIISMIGIFFLFFGRLDYLLIGALILNFGFIIDTSDGEVARYRKKSSVTGLQIDELSHQLLPKLMYFGVAFGIFLQTNQISVLIFGFLAALFSTSIVNSALYWAVIKTRFRKIEQKSTKKEKKIDKDNKIMKLGEIKGKFSILYDISKNIKFLWICPYDKLILFFLIIIEITNKYYLQIIPVYSVLYWYIIIYGVLFTIIQSLSFVISVKSRNADKIYNYVFNK